ncbi:MAG: imelysin family protein, partial [Chloroflexota bacterium]
MTHSFSKLSAMIIIVLGIFLVQVENSQSQTFDREAMLEGMITETILPLHTTFAEQATTLSTTALDFQADPTPETLATLQSAWVETSIAYGHIEVYRFRRVMPFINQLDSIPPNIEFIEAYIADEETLDADIAESLGSQLKGLATLEYLIFTDDAISLLTENEARLAYMSAVAADIERVANELVAQWTLDAGGYGDRFLSADGEPNSVRSSISMLSNEMIAILEDVTTFGLGVPLGYENRGEVQPARVYAPYSNTTRDRLVANIEGFE